MPQMYSDLNEANEFIYKTEAGVTDIKYKPKLPKRKLGGEG